VVRVQRDAAQFSEPPLPVGRDAVDQPAAGQIRRGLARGPQRLDRERRQQWHLGRDRVAPVAVRLDAIRMAARHHLRHDAASRDLPAGRRLDLDVRPHAMLPAEGERPVPVSAPARRQSAWSASAPRRVARVRQQHDQPPHRRCRRFARGSRRASGPGCRPSAAWRRTRSARKPCSIPTRIAASVFSGASVPPPRWATTRA
jgi:hypothetical protein